jgi:hypothetical protein
MNHHQMVMIIHKIYVQVQLQQHLNLLQFRNLMNYHLHLNNSIHHKYIILHHLLVFNIMYKHDIFVTMSKYLLDYYDQVIR